MALYRRYRPQKFQDVIGQEQVTRPLMVALRGEKTAHAYLFSGPRGCGKTTSARILARCLNCEQAPTDTPCGECESCRELSLNGSGSLDVVEMDAASHGGVDDARDLIERASFAPARDRYKIFIIDEAHMVSNQGFNALLKLVEEPPPHVKFIFATTEPEKVIGTIRSRTHHYPFRLVPPETLSSFLEQIAVDEGIAVGTGVIPLVVRSGGGSVRDSLSVLDQLIGGAEESALTYESAIALLGYTDGSLLDTAVEAVASSDGGGLFTVVDQVVESGQDPRRFVEDLLQRLRDVIIIALAGDSASDVFTSVPQDQYTRMNEQAQHLGAARASHAADLVNDALSLMVGATSPRLQLELLCARLLIPAAVSSESQPEVSQSQNGASGGGTPVAAPSGGPIQRPASAQYRSENRAVPPGRAPGRPVMATWAAPQNEKPAQNAPEPDALESAGSEPAAPEVEAVQPVAQPAPAQPAPGLSEPVQPEPAQPAPVQPEEVAASPGNLQFDEHWETILTKLRSTSRVAQSMALTAASHTLEGNELTLVFNVSSLAHNFVDRGHGAALAAAVRDVLSIEVEVRAVADSSAPKVEAASQAASSVDGLPEPVEPAESEPADSEPADSEPADSEPADSESANLAPAEVAQPDENEGSDPAGVLAQLLNGSGARDSASASEQKVAPTEKATPESAEPVASPQAGSNVSGQPVPAEPVSQQSAPASTQSEESQPSPSVQPAQSVQPARPVQPAPTHTPEPAPQNVPFYRQQMPTLRRPPAAQTAASSAAGESISSRIMAAHGPQSGSGNSAQPNIPADRQPSDSSPYPLSDEDEVSADDPLVEQTNLVGIDVVLETFGGTIVEETTQEDRGF